MRTTCISLLFVLYLTTTGCESNKPPQDVRLQISDIQQVTQGITTKLVASDFLASRTSDSPPIIITCRKAENLSMDIVEEGELWMFVHKIETSLNAGNLARAKNISFQLPPERVAILRQMYPDIASGALPATHAMTCSIRDANRVKNDKEGYVDSRARLYYFDYNITRLIDGSIEWNGSAEFKRSAKGKLGD